MSAAPRRAAVVAAFALLPSLLPGCARAPRPEQQLSVTTADGRLVPPDSVTVSYAVGGVQVIQRPNAANDVVAVHLYLLGGARQLTPATQGIEALLLEAAAFGTARYPGSTSRAAWARTGSELAVTPEADWTLYAFRGVRQQFDSSWNVFADRLVHPTLAGADVALARSRLVSRLRQQRQNPDGLLFLLADSVAFAGHPYGLQPHGTEASLAALDSAALARYAAEQLVTSRMLLVVVGNVRRDEVERAVARSLAALPHGSYAWTLPARLPDPGLGDVPRVALTARALPTNYLLGVFQGPPPTARDYAAFQVATAMLGGRLHRVIREQGALSYAAAAPFQERGVPTGGIYVSTTQPGLALILARAQVNDIRHLPSGLYGMHTLTDQFVLEFLAEHATSSAQAEFLARAQLYRGDYRKANQAMEELRHVTSDDVRRAAEHYIANVHFVYVGDTTRVTRAALERFSDDLR